MAEWQKDFDAGPSNHGCRTETGQEPEQHSSLQDLFADDYGAQMSLGVLVVPSHSLKVISTQSNHLTEQLLDDLSERDKTFMETASELEEYQYLNSVAFLLNQRRDCILLPPFGHSMT